MQHTLLNVALHFRDLRPTTSATIFENEDGAPIACLDIGADSTREFISLYFHRPEDLWLIASAMEEVAAALESKHRDRLTQLEETDQ